MTERQYNICYIFISLGDFLLFVIDTDYYYTHKMRLSLFVHYEIHTYSQKDFSKPVSNIGVIDNLIGNSIN